MQGTIKFYDKDKGYSFIEPDHPNQKDVYFTSHSIKGQSLQAGDRVSFELTENNNGYVAVGIRKVAARHKC